MRDREGRFVARDPRAPARLDLGRASRRHGVPDRRRRVPHPARRDDRARGPRRGRIAVHRDRGDLAAGPTGDARRLEDAGVRLGERPGRPGLAPSAPRSRRSSEGSCSSLRPAGDSTASPSSSRSSSRCGSAGTRENIEETADGLYAASVPGRNAERVTLAALTTLVPISRLDAGAARADRRGSAHPRRRSSRSSSDWLPSFSSDDPDAEAVSSVKVAELRTFVVGNPPPSFGGRYFVFLSLTTDDGIKGVGEVYAATFHPTRARGDDRRRLRSPRRGRRPVRDRDAVEADLDARLLGSPRSLAHGRPERDRDGVLGHRRQGGGTACVRPSRRSRARPAPCLHLSLYGARRPVGRVHGPGPRGRARGRLRRAGLHRAEVRPARPVLGVRPASAEPRGARRARRRTSGRVRDAVGDRCDLLVGTHGQFTAGGCDTAGAPARALRSALVRGAGAARQPEEMAVVARATSIPIATGERLTTKHEFARVLATGAAAILQPNLGRVGGLLEAQEDRRLAEAHYAQIAPHLYCGPVVGAANIQLAACSPNFLVLEGIGRWDGFHAQILRQPIRWEDGYVHPADRAGPRGGARRGGRTRSPLRRRRAASDAAPSTRPADACRLCRHRSPRRSLLAASLLRAGFALSVHDLDRSAARALEEAGADWADSPAAAARGADAASHVPARRPTPWRQSSRARTV